MALPLRHTLHYAIPKEWIDKPGLVGARVLAPVGRRGVSGVIVGRSNTAPGEFRIRRLSRILEGPGVSPEVLSLCQWVATYYDAPLGEVLKAAAPPGAQASGREKLELTDAGRNALASGALPPKFAVVLASLEAGGAIDAQKAKRAGLVGTVRSELENRGWVRVSLADVGPRMKKQTRRMVRRPLPVTDSLRESLKRSPRKIEILEAVPEKLVAIKEFEEKYPRAGAHLRTLAKSGLIEISRVPVETETQLVDEDGLSASVHPPQLTTEQVTALEAICGNIEKSRFHPYLLFGVTGSGKTEVYLQAIDRSLKEGKGAIVLVPEISLTPQLAARFRARFGDQVAVLHSGLRPRERFIEWHRLSEGKARIALGARSAVFAPVANIGIVVIDEEHDSSFKQEEGVRYHARTVALMRAKAAGAVCVLGSATPSIETFHASNSGTATRLELPQRATGQQMPEVEIVDMRQFQPDGDSFLTAPLTERVEEVLAKKEQAILFLNRRGFQTFVVCTSCGDACRCKDCSVSLTYHRSSETLACHYCGHRQSVPSKCSGCGSKRIVKKGIGTERVADAVAKRFPGARVGRLDRDTGGGANVARLLGKMGRGELDILVGTQMVSKGHDFPRVTLVGALCADTGLSLPDFRASEKTFQLLTQVAGRAGRGELAGRVVVQTYRPECLAVACAAKHDFLSFFDKEAVIRKELGYPPFGYLAAVRVDGPASNQVEQTSRKISAELRGFLMEKSGVSVLGPSAAPLSRLRGKTRWHVWLRADSREQLRACVRFLRTLSCFGADAGNVRVSIDVDPVSTL